MCFLMSTSKGVTIAQLLSGFACANFHFWAFETAGVIPNIGTPLLSCVKTK